MNELKRWALTVCVVAVISAVFELLIPDRKYESLLRPVIAAFAVYAVIAPVGGVFRSCADGASDVPRGEISAGLRETVDRQAADMVSAFIAAEIRRAMSGLAPECGVEVFAETGADGSVTVTGAALTLGGPGLAAESVIKERAASASGLDEEKISVIYE